MVPGAQSSLWEGWGWPPAEVGTGLGHMTLRCTHMERPLKVLQTRPRRPYQRLRARGLPVNDCCSFGRWLLRCPMAPAPEELGRGPLPSVLQGFAVKSGQSPIRDTKASVKNEGGHTSAALPLAKGCSPLTCPSAASGRLPHLCRWWGVWPGHPSTRKLKVPLDSPSQEAR